MINNDVYFWQQYLSSRFRSKKYLLVVYNNGLYIVKKRFHFIKNLKFVNYVNINDSLKNIELFLKEYGFAEVD